MKIMSMMVFLLYEDRLLDEGKDQEARMRGEENWGGDEY